jgi:predicted dehydrogenase
MTLRVACLGAGYFAQFHHEAWHRNPGVEFVGVCDLDIDKANASGAAGYTDLQAMLTNGQPDILDIATPPQTHASAIRTALEAGVKAIICQKPFCISLEEAEEITALAEASGTPLIIHENFRFQPWYREIKKRIDAGDIGEVQQVTFRLRTGDGQGPEAYLDRQPYFQQMPRLLIHETGVHFIDTFAYLLGEPLAVYSDMRRMNPVIKGEDAAMLVMDFDGNKRALFDGNRLLDHAAENCRTTLGEALIEGTGGTMSLAGDGSVRRRRFGAMDEDIIWPAQDYPSFGGDCVYHLQNHVVAALSGRGSLENTARDYLKVRTVEYAAYRSAETGAKIIL